MSILMQGSFWGFEVIVAKCRGRAGDGIVRICIQVQEKEGHRIELRTIFKATWLPNDGLQLV
jgi:hypothetical protein